ncbi:MAG: hypothetical protein P8X66_10220, partial [Maritimibacter sp.]
MSENVASHTDQHNADGEGTSFCRRHIPSQSEQALYPRRANRAAIRAGSLQSTEEDFMKRIGKLAIAAAAAATLGAGAAYG